MLYLLRATPAVLAFSFLASCATTSPSGMGAAPTPTPTTGPAAPAAPDALAPFMGLYTGDWGTIVLRQVGDEIWGAYTHDAGAIRGTVAGNVFTGRWCEDPARTGDADSGNVTFTFEANADGVRTIDGTWGYGDAEPSNPDWDVTLAPDQTDASLEARFDDAAQFCR